MSIMDPSRKRPHDLSRGCWRALPSDPLPEPGGDFPGSTNTAVIVGGDRLMFQYSSSACLQGPHLPARLLRPSRPVVRKGLCQSGAPPEARDSTIRFELVARVRREIAAGVYDTPEKMDLALARMLERLDLA